MIQAIYVLVADSGLCVLDRKYGEASMDPNLISGFLTALIQFGREMSSGNRVHVIDFGAFDICMSLRENVIVAGVVDKTDDTNAAMAVLSDVNNAFLKTYAETMENWDGNLEPFEAFKPNLDDITKNGRASEKRVLVPILKGKVSPMLVRLGQISQQAFEVAQMCKGNLTVRAIADQLGKPVRDVQKSMQDLEDLRILEWKELH